MKAQKLDCETQLIDEDDLETAEDYKTVKHTRSGIIESNQLYNKTNTLTIALDTLKTEWIEFEDTYKEMKKTEDGLQKVAAENK